MMFTKVAFAALALLASNCTASVKLTLRHGRQQINGQQQEELTLQLFNPNACPIIALISADCDAQQTAVNGGNVYLVRQLSVNGTTLHATAVVVNRGVSDGEETDITFTNASLTLMDDLDVEAWIRANNLSVIELLPLLRNSPAPKGLLVEQEQNSAAQEMDAVRRWTLEGEKFCKAVLNGVVDEVNMLLRRTNKKRVELVNYVDECGETPLIIAVGHNDWRMTDALLKAGANIEWLRTGDARSALDIATSNNSLYAIGIVRLLIDASERLGRASRFNYLRSALNYAPDYPDGKCQAKELLTAKIREVASEL